MYLCTNRTSNPHQRRPPSRRCSQHGSAFLEENTRNRSRPVSFWSRHTSGVLVACRTYTPFRGGRNLVSYALARLGARASAFAAGFVNGGAAARRAYVAGVVDGRAGPGEARRAPLHPLNRRARRRGVATGPCPCRAVQDQPLRVRRRRRRSLQQKDRESKGRLVEEPGRRLRLTPELADEA